MDAGLLFYFIVDPFLAVVLVRKSTREFGSVTYRMEEPVEKTMNNDLCNRTFIFIKNGLKSLSGKN